MIWFTTECALNLPPKTFLVYVNPTSVRSVLLGTVLSTWALRLVHQKCVYLHTNKTYAYMLEPRISLAAVVVSFWCTYHIARLQQRGAAVVILSSENDSLETCMRFLYFHAFTIQITSQRVSASDCYVFFVTHFWKDKYYGNGCWKLLSKPFANIV